MRKFVEEDLLARIRSGDTLETERNIITCLPIFTEHHGHPMEENGPEPIDKRVSAKITELVRDGVSSVSAIQKQLCGYVKEICSPLPHPCNPRFYPSAKAISNQIYRAGHVRLCNDQVNVTNLYGREFYSTGFGTRSTTSDVTSRSRCR